MSASIKFRIIDEDRVAERSKRFSMSDDGSTVAEAIQKGLNGLERPPLKCRLNMYGQSRGGDVEMDHEYAFIDSRLEDSIRVPPPTPPAITAVSPPATKAMAATLPPSTPTSMAATLSPSTPIAMAASPPPYDRVLMDDGSAVPSTSAAASNERPTAPAARKNWQQTK